MNTHANIAKIIRAIVQIVRTGRSVGHKVDEARSRTIAGICNIAIEDRWITTGKPIALEVVEAEARTVACVRIVAFGVVC